MSEVYDTFTDADGRRYIAGEVVSEQVWTRFEALRAAADSLADAAEAAIGIARWMSGAEDFGPGGQAHAGWVKARAELDVAAAALSVYRNTKGDEASE